MTQLDFLKARLEATVSPMDYLATTKASPDNFILVDVRNAPPHIKKVKITGAIEIPEKDLATRLNELPKDKMIIVYCWDVWCNLATKASIILLENGYTVKELYGGIAAWQILTLPVTPLV
jgi:rhodanese-related sulfurtransferase